MFNVIFKIHETLLPNLQDKVTWLKQNKKGENQK